MELEQQIKAK
jgi:hypothetical protein